MQDQNFNQNYNQNQGNYQGYNDVPENAGVDLADFEETFTGAEKPDGDFPELPDGHYQANLERIELTRSKNSGEPMIKWTLRIIGPTHRGRMLWRYNVIKHDPQRMGYIKKDLFTCGIELEKFSDLPNRFDEMINTKLEITVQKKGEFQNIYLNRRIVTEEPATQQQYDKDLIPF